MSWVDKVRGIIMRRRVERELAEELEFHTALLTRDLEAAGLAPEAARRAARRRVGDPVGLREQATDVWGWRWYDQLTQDLRSGVRSLHRAPGHSFTTILVLALGIGAMSAVFSVASLVLLRPLPFPSPDQLHAVTAMTRVQAQLSYPDALDMRAAMSNVELTLTRPSMFVTRGRYGTEVIQGAYVLENFFHVFGQEPQIGRIPTAAEAATASPVVISYAFWKDWLGGKADVLGDGVQLGDRMYSVAAVMPRSFSAAWPDEMVWVPASHLTAVQSAGQPRGAGYTGNSAYARIRGDHAAGMAELERSAAMASRAGGATAEPWTVQATSLFDVVHGSAGRPLLLTLLAAGLVMVIVCANAGGLVLVRVMARQRELTIRAALGAGRWRVGRQLVAESAVLCAVASLFGVGLAHLAIGTVRVTAPGLVPRLQEARLDGGALLFVCSLLMLCTVVLGLLPLAAARQSGASTVLAGGRAGEPLRAGRLRATLVVAQSAVAVVLLAGAGLLLKSAVRVQSADNIGFDVDRVIAVPLPFPGASGLAPAVVQERAARVRAALAQVPGVQAAGTVDYLPYRGMNIRPFSAEGRADQAVVRTADAGFFRAMGLRVLQGRPLLAQDESGAAVAVVSSGLATSFFGQRGAIGRRLDILMPGPEPGAAPEPVQVEVVGVIQDVRAMRPDVDAPPEIYLARNPSRPSRRAALAVRVDELSDAQLHAVRDAVARLEPDVPLTGIGTMTATVQELSMQRRFASLLITSFAGVALVLAAVGVYGVMAFSVSQRRREFGIRLAVGAAPHRMLRMIAAEAARLALTGAVLGLAGALMLGRLFDAYLFQVEARDPRVLAGACIVLALAGLAAAVGPASRAMRVDPATVLRTD